MSDDRTARAAGLLTEMHEAELRQKFVAELWDAATPAQRAELATAIFTAMQAKVASDSHDVRNMISLALREHVTPMIAALDEQITTRLRKYLTDSWESTVREMMTDAIKAKASSVADAIADALRSERWIASRK